jgi:formamidopyrimidine-DNA glycosylase
MPELPEVQCVVNSIKDKIENKKIKKIVRFSKNLREPLSNDLFKLENSTVKKIIRRGKYIIITLESNKDFYLIVHLGMTGSLLFKENMTSPMEFGTSFGFRYETVSFQSS